MSETPSTPPLRGSYTRQYENKLAFRYVMSKDLTYVIYDGDKVVLPHRDGETRYPQEFIFEYDNRLLLGDGRELGSVEIISMTQTSRLPGMRNAYMLARAEAEKVIYPLLIKRKLQLLIE